MTQVKSFQNRFHHLSCQGPGKNGVTESESQGVGQDMRILLKLSPEVVSKCKSNSWDARTFQ